MAYFIKIGAIPSTYYGVGSRGYHIYRRGRKVVTVWGGVLVTANRQIFWSRTTQHQVSKQSSVAKAEALRKDLCRQRENSARYSRLPPGTKIMRTARSASSTEWKGR